MTTATDTPSPTPSLYRVLPSAPVAEWDRPALGRVGSLAFTLPAVPGGLWLSFRGSCVRGNLGGREGFCGGVIGPFRAEWVEAVSEEETGE